MYPGSMDLGFWFCDTAHDAPCKLLCRAMFEEEFPYRLPIILLSFAFLATTQLIYYSCCIICPFLICQCYSNPPEWWFLYDDDDDEEEVPMTLARMKQQMALSETLDYRIFSELSKEERTIMSESCVICLYNYNDDDKVVRPKKCRHGFHEDCLASWLCTSPMSHHSVCPCCRTQISMKPPSKVAEE